MDLKYLWNLFFSWPPTKTLFSWAYYIETVCISQKIKLLHGIFHLGTGCAPFRSLIEDRVAQSAGGKLQFGLGGRKKGGISE